jgi:hemerythrin-like metal-binding protein
MMYWSDALNTGVEVIDEDHRALFGLINNVQSASENDDDSWKIGVAIEELNNYANNHFKREEALMLLCGYSAIERHEKDHVNFRNVVTSLRHIYASCPQMVSIAGVIGFLEDWLQTHIAVTDHAYIEEMRKNSTLIDAASKNLMNNMGGVI